MTDRTLVTDIRVRNAIQRLDMLEEWLTYLPERDRWLTNSQRHDLDRAINRVMTRLGHGSDLREVHASSHGSETRPLDKMAVHGEPG